MHFIKNNILSLFGMVVYILWWLYLLFDFNKEVYDNHYAGAVGVEFIAEITILLILIYVVCFLIAAFKTKKWKKYIAFITLILIPPLVTILVNLS
jgi:hypothetical protein